ncbi:microtubule-associated protein futsch [Aplysia californica]|uniref:Microtubule-associated protein futsch n=1 Tax=Aplysia californica TaxID=6500 RepID=A0ABM0JHX2_APLCA|nr:microtubule-associated protein futsch [Aplysia californica]
MGNRQGSQKQKEAKSKEEKKREKETKKDQEKQRKKKEKLRKKKSGGGHHGSGLDTDLEDSSHVTGGDSESSVFHSAENVSASPYLDSCTRSELEQVPMDGSAASFTTRWGGPASSASAYQLHNQQYQQRHQDSHHFHHHHHHHQQHHHHQRDREFLYLEQQHPMVLSSKDFRDGFSLEAFIPPEIARRETSSSYLDDSPMTSISRADGRGRSGSSVKSKRSTTSDSVKSRSSKSSHVAPTFSSHHATPTSLRSHTGEDSASMTSSQTSAGGGAGGYSTPLLSTPVFGRVERSHSPLSATASTSLPRVREVERGDNEECSPLLDHTSGSREPSSPLSQNTSLHHHPHFFNHQRNQKQQQQQELKPTQKQLQQLQQLSNEHYLIEQQQLRNQHQQNLSHPFPGCPPDYRNLPKPLSPHPQRRALSPKMTSAPFKLISSDDSSSSPTTPVPQRRAANFLDLLRPGSKNDKNNSKKNKRGGEKGGRSGGGGKGGGGEGGEEDEMSTPRGGKGGKSDSSTNTNESDGGKVKTKPKWKTWERSSKKSGERQSKVSMIFGTVRKSDKKKKNVQDSGIGGDGKTEVQNEEKQKKSKYSVAKSQMPLVGCSNNAQMVNDTEPGASNKIQTSRKGHQERGDNSDVLNRNNRNSSPPMVKSAAFCIMRLEELERNIENTIREKFPDAEPFLLKKRSKDEELKGSRSLPTTPSLKKKLFIARDVDGSKRHSGNNEDVTRNLSAVSSKLSDAGARGSDATYESLPSPAMSPVVLRRFGARTRHASISPKIQRAKTAALYNSPREMSRVEESQASATKTVTKVPVYRAVSREQPISSMMSSQFVSSLAHSQKSQSKYDNVNDESDEEAKGMQQLKSHSGASNQLVRQGHVEEYDSDEVYESPTTYDVGNSTENKKPVIVPTFSAVFGSVSPKLKRHLGGKINEASTNREQSGVNKEVKGAGNSSQQISGITSKNEEMLTRATIDSQSGTKHELIASDVRSFSLDTACDIRGQKVKDQRSPLDGREVLDKQGIYESADMRGARVSVKKDSSPKVSVRERIKTINKSLSEGSGPPGTSAGAVSINSTTNKMGSVDSSDSSERLSSSPYHRVGGEGAIHGRPVIPPFPVGAILSPTESTASPSLSSTASVKTGAKSPSISGSSTAALRSPPAPPTSCSKKPTSPTLGNDYNPSHSPRQQQIMKNSDASAARQHEHPQTRSGVVYSPGGTRKHSIEHVVFGSAVALPCRLYAQPMSSSSLEENNEHKTAIAHAHDPLSSSPASSPPQNQNQKNRNVAKNQTRTGEGDKKEITSPHNSASLSETATGSTISDRCSGVSETLRTILGRVPSERSQDTVNNNNSNNSINDNSQLEASVENSGLIDCSDGVKATSDAKPFINNEASARIIKVSVQSQQAAVSETRSFKETHFPETGDVFNDGEDYVDSNHNHNHHQHHNVGGFQRQKQYQQLQQQQQQHEYKPQYREDDEQKYVVLRQPVSKVICDMISTSKQGHRSSPQQPLLRQSSPTSPEQERHAPQAVAMVTSPAHQQPCLTLEEKTVRSDSSVSLPSSPICNLKRIERDFGGESAERVTKTLNFESRSAGSQTDSYSTADKGVESADFEMYAQNLSAAEGPSKSPDNIIKSASNATSSSEVVRPKFIKVPEDSDEETKFLKNVLAFKRTDVPPKKECVAKVTDGDPVEFMPPPPSPSAMDQLIEEFEEEDEDDDVQERKEIEIAMQKESEIREFTDKIYKRLSDLLGSHSGGEDIDDDVFEDDPGGREKVVRKKRHVDELLSRLEGKSEEECEEEGEEEEESGESFEDEEDEQDAQIASERIAAKAVVTSTKSPSTNRTKKVMTIKSSSSSITTTTSSSEDEEVAEKLALTNLMLQQQQQREEDREGRVEEEEEEEEEEEGEEDEEQDETLHSSDTLGFEEIEGAPKLKTTPNYFVFPEFDGEGSDGGMDDKRRYSSSRDYHSDDDVARGQGIPDYYDDRPLWRRKEKPPGQLSLDMVAMRRRERRERWLKKRRRNKTDLLSAASSDTGSETSLVKVHPRLRNQQSSLDSVEAERMLLVDTAAEPRNDMGSGILSSPKYAKPILPFFNKDKVAERGTRGAEEVREERIEASIISERLQATAEYSHLLRDSYGDDGHNDDSYSRDRGRRPRDSFEKDNSSDGDDGFEGGRATESGRALDSGKDPRAFMSDPDLAIPGIEETFNELMSVKHILEGMSDRAPSAPTGEASERETKFMPLTKENVRSVREYYKDTYSFNNGGRRSRMSNTDRTESDLDIYSETHDDASSDSNMYADDEEDDDGIDPYTTADDELGATGGSESDIMLTGNRRRRRDNHALHTNEDDEDDDENANFVIGCTFYNSNTFSPSTPAVGSNGNGANQVSPSVMSSNAVIGSSGKVTPSTLTGTSPSTPATLVASVLNSDEEFWAGSSAIEASYQQLETAADAVSSTFQNAREQMIDIQQHLQALRRQMEGLQDDLTSTSVTLTPDNLS